MKENDYLLLVASVGAILYGCFGKNFYYGRGRASWSSTPPKPAPTWFGRVMWIGCGLLFLISALFNLSK